MNLYGLKVIDFHSHFPVRHTGSSGWRQRLVEQYGEEKANVILENSQRYRGEWRKMWGFDPPETETHSDEEQADRWAADLDVKGVERVNFVTGGGNDRLAKIVAMDPERFTGFAHHDPFSEDADRELERAIEELGLRGYKMIASSQTRPVDDEALYPLWEAADRLKVPVVMHFGVLGGGGGPPRDLRNMNPLTLWEVASSFTTVSFVVPHFGACYWRELLQLCWACPNVLIDSSGSNQWMRWMPYRLTMEDLMGKVMETVGAGRLVFGTDSSYFPRGFSVEYVRQQLMACRSMGLDEGSVEKIFHGNAERLLGLA